MFMCNNMNSSNTIVISMKALIGIFNVSRQSISKAIKYLKDNDLLYVYKNGTSNIYVINQNVVCFQSGANTLGFYYFLKEGDYMKKKIMIGLAVICAVEGLVSYLYAKKNK